MDGANLVCTNQDCEGGDLYDVLTWMNTLGSVKGLGWSTQSAFLEHIDIKSVDDFYKLDPIKLISFRDVAGVGDSSYKLINEMIAKLNSDITFSEFLIACNLKGLGWSSASKIADSRDVILNYPLGDDKSFIDKLVGIKGMNVTARDSIYRNIGKIRRYASLIKIVS